MVASSSRFDDTRYWKKQTRANPHLVVPGRNSQAGANAENRSINRKKKTVDPRFILWIDSVGGYLVCTHDEVVIGQAVPESHIAIPILGDLARNHLKLIRTSEGYVLEPIGYVRVNGTEMAGNSLLRNGDRIELTGGIIINFVKPHPLSATVRLDFESPHRTSPWSDAVLLMAESCVLGPNRRNHVVCPGWSEDLVFFRKNRQLFCKSLRPVKVDGSIIEGTGVLRPDSYLEGDDFSMTFEPFGF